MNGVTLSAAYERQSLLLSANFTTQQQQGQTVAGDATGQSGSGGDVLALGNGQTITANISLQLVVERATARLQAKLTGNGVAVPQTNPAATSSAGSANGAASAGASNANDLSPQGVADRIVNFATGFLNNYVQNHPEMNNDQAVSGFENLVRNAIDEGFKQAGDALNSLNALTPQISNTIQQTHDLVTQELDAFFAQPGSGNSNSGTTPTTGAQSGNGQTSIDYQAEQTSISISLTYTQQSQLAQNAQNTGNQVSVTG